LNGFHGFNKQLCPGHRYAAGRANISGRPRLEQESILLRNKIIKNQRKTLTTQAKAV
jgi:hypothetical protein